MKEKFYDKSFLEISEFHLFYNVSPTFKISQSFRNDFRLIFSIIWVILIEVLGFLNKKLL